MELYSDRNEAQAAADAKPRDPAKFWYITRVESGHWAVVWKWDGVSVQFAIDKKNNFQ